MANPPDNNIPGTGNTGSGNNAKPGVPSDKIEKLTGEQPPKLSSGVKPTVTPPAQQTPPPLPKSEFISPRDKTSTSTSTQAKTPAGNTTPAQTPPVRTAGTTRPVSGDDRINLANKAPADSTRAAGTTASVDTTTKKPAGATTTSERSKLVRPEAPIPRQSETRGNTVRRPPSERPGKSAYARGPEGSRAPQYQERSYRQAGASTRRPQERPPSRRRRMAPPPGAKRGRYVAPARRPAAYAADTGSAWAPLLLGCLLLLGVLWYAIKYYAPDIEDDLAVRTNSALANAGYGDSTNVEIDGRNAILNGSVATQPDSDRAEEVVTNTEGVRSVENNLTIGDAAEPEETAEPEEPAEPVDSKLTLFSKQDGVKLSGTVPDQETADAITNAANEAYGEENVSGDLTIDPNSTAPAWLPAVQELTPDLGNIEGGSFSALNGSLRLTGVAPDEQTKSDITAKAAQLLEGKLTVDNRMTVAEPPPPPLRAGNATFYNGANRITLFGHLPQDSISQIEEAFSSAGKPVESFIKASDEYAAPAWAENFGNSFAAMSEIDQGKVKVLDTEEVAIYGTAASEEAKQSAEEKVAAVFDGKNISNEIVVELPEPEPAPEPAPVQPFMSPFASVTDNGSSVTLSGLLAASTADALTTALENSGKSVNSLITVDERVMEPTWADAIGNALNAMAAIENPGANISSSGELTITGIANSETDRQQAANDTLATFSDPVTLRNNITVRGPDLSDLLAQIDLSAIRFRTNSSELDADSVNILNQVADALLQVPSATVEIVGHTDSTGNDQRNLQLSGERAEQVLNFLLNSGVAGDRMTSRGYGSSQPIASNETVTGRALNRRIELVLTNGE